MLTEAATNKFTGSIGNKVFLILANISYPYSLYFFFGHLSDFKDGSWVAALAALCAFLAAILVPALGLLVVWAAGKNIERSRGALSLRRFAYFSVATPPLYTATGVVLFTIEVPGRDIVVWSVGWLIVLIFLLVTRSGSTQKKNDEKGLPPEWLRWGHGIAAALLLIGFVFLHLANHSVSLVGTETHANLQSYLRLWYRSRLVEPVLVLLVLWLVFSGIWLARFRTISFVDWWGTVQTASGAYLGAFLFSHLTAALIMARMKFGIDTNWVWASGSPVGLLGDPWNVRLIPHYLLAVAAVITHAACGLRIVLLSHGISAEKTKLVTLVVVACGLTLSGILTSALLGLRLI